MGRLSRETVGLRGVVEAAGDPPKVIRHNQTVEGLIDGGTRPKIGKVVRCPDSRFRWGGDAVPDSSWDAGWVIWQWFNPMSEQCRKILTLPTIILYVRKLLL